jgi:diaminopimelate decarboxylase
MEEKMKLNGQVTDAADFYQGHKPHDLLRAYGSPLYVYNERIFRKNCRDLIRMCPYPHFQVNYSIKANSNLTLLKIVRSEGIKADAVSPGEIIALEAAGFKPEDIFYITNNASAEDMHFAVARGILMSMDSVSQLETYGCVNPGGRVALRFNPGIGAGHHANVVTAGQHTKFGINEEYIPEIKRIAARYDLQIVGLNQHIGSQVMRPTWFMASVERLMSIAKHFKGLEFIDLGGGFGIPYKKQQGEMPLDLTTLGNELARYMEDFSKTYCAPGEKLTFKVEPGRYIPAESGVLLGTVNDIKYNGEDKYIGTDIGLSVLIRPVLYDAYHEIEVYREGGEAEPHTETVRVVGNICETGDYIAKERTLPVICEGDALGVLDAGAYCYAMASTYNHRLRPAEVLICEDGTLKIIRKRDTYEDLLRNMDV